MLALVGVHIVAVFASSRLRREDLVRAMITGCKLGRPDEAISRARTGGRCIGFRLSSVPPEPIGPIRCEFRVADGVRDVPMPQVLRSPPALGEPTSGRRRASPCNGDFGFYRWWKQR